MEEIVAQSNSLRNRHVTPKTIALDAIPSLVRALPQVHAETNRLPHLQAHNAPALRLFSNIGFELDKLRRAVSRLDSTSFAETTRQPEAPFRGPNWLGQRALQETRLSLNTELRQLSSSDFHAETRRAAATLLGKLRALSIPEAVTGLHTPRTERMTMTHRTPRTPASPGGTAYHLPYISAITAIALHGDAPSAPSLMHETATSVGDDGHFVECLAVLASVSRFSPPSPSPLPDLVVWGARVVLEDQFGDCIPGLPSKPRMARSAAIIPQIALFVTRKYPRASPEALIWAQAFYCLRVGHVRAASQILQDADLVIEEHSRCIHCLNQFMEGGKKIHAAFLEKRTLPSGDEEEMSDGTSLHRDMSSTPGCLMHEEDYQQLSEEYQRVAWRSDIPYMRLVYVLVARLELLPNYRSAADALQPGSDISRHPTPEKHEQFSLAVPERDIAELLPSVEDYIWFRLWLCRTPAESPMLSVLRNSNVVTQAQIQEDITTYGPAHFDPDGEQPLVYAFVLVAAGMFEQAVSFLFSHPDEQCLQCSIHFALVLYHLNWMKDETTFHRQLIEFVSVFSNMYPAEASMYLLTIKDKKVLQKVLKELIISVGEYETLLGRAWEDGNSESGGILAKLLSSASVPLPSGFSSEELSAVRKEAALHGAIATESKREYASAAELYSLAGDFVKRVEMIMRNVAEEVYKLSSSSRAVAVAEANSLLRSLRGSDASKVPEKLRKSLLELTKIAKVFEEYWTGRYLSAWSALRHVRIIPLTTGAVAESHRPQTTVDTRFDKCVGECLLELLKAGLHIAEHALESGNVGNNARSAPGQTGGLFSVQTGMPDASEVKNLCIFAGVTGITNVTINERLVRVELLLT